MPGGSVICRTTLPTGVGRTWAFLPVALTLLLWRALDGLAAGGRARALQIMLTALRLVFCGAAILAAANGQLATCRIWHLLSVCKRALDW